MYDVDEPQLDDELDDENEYPPIAPPEKAKADDGRPCVVINSISKTTGILNHSFINFLNYHLS